MIVQKFSSSLAMELRRLPLLLIFVAISICSIPSATGSDVCPVSDLASLVGVGDHRFRCPAGFQLSPVPPREVTGEFLDMVSSHGQKNTFLSILFYASWCPFSQHALHRFEALSSMYPQIEHLSIEESSALPRYGVHSFPTILFINQSSIVRYQGHKDLSSLVHFYKKLTGLEPVAFISNDQQPFSQCKGIFTWNGSLRDMMIREPYLAFSIVFICIRVLLHLFPGIFYRVRLFCLSYLCHLNMGILRELSQHLKQSLHLIDMNKLWSKLRLSKKTRNFQKGATNARVWASSLASVSLGESSSSRTVSPDS